MQVLDIDISSADGTSVPRSQRYHQLREQIDGMTDRYNQFMRYDEYWT